MTITANDIQTGCYSTLYIGGGMSFRIECITNERDIERCTLLTDILFDEYRLYATISDDCGYLIVNIDNTDNYTDSKLCEILVNEINNLLS